MASYTTETVLAVQHWSEQLFSFRTTRNPALRFENGQFIMVGLEADGRKLVRAYSVASANYEEHLEFYSIKVPDGPLTSRLQHIAPGSKLLISAKPTGTLVLRDLRAGKRLFLLATGTGVAPFIGIVKDPETYEKFPQVVLVRGGRTAADLRYGDAALAALRADPYLGDLVRERLFDYPCLTRESHPHRGRVTNLIESGRVCEDLGISPLDTDADRFMICGNMRMLADATRILDARGLEVSAHIGVPGDYVFERAFVESLDAGLTAQESAV
jgi:ferredoxin--NADP+ reductase